MVEALGAVELGQFVDPGRLRVEPESAAAGTAEVRDGMAGLGLRPAATLALAAGVHPKVVQVRLGHSNISITLDTYSHVVKGLQHEAAEKVGRSAR